MAELIRGTTPTIKIAFKTIDTSAISVAYLCFKRGTATILEKSLESAIVQPGYISWTLTQQESFRLAAHQNIQVMCDWKLASGTRGRSTVLSCKIEPTGKNEVI